ncbi:DUF1800 domain-containing protein [Cryptosporangium arvum]|uniref:DUF1800 domain-containing protein n=1 Tax=Cryptosporangium arvum DSM 44712 TaxID=927661 RepID=A0A010ZPG6_9ACTN|nr:DUF1800 domain-containing protein [Cryptosporangium arvum]EXG79122.1 Protein of unknown function (DUF1800) [Cryptosporangium arvum DSM 44712]
MSERPGRSTFEPESRRWGRRGLVTGALAAAGLAVAACSKDDETPPKPSTKTGGGSPVDAADSAGPAQSSTAGGTAPTGGDTATKSLDRSTGGNSRRAAGRQARTVRTYSDRDQSYAAAGKPRRRPSVPAKLYSGPAAAATATKVGSPLVFTADPVLHLVRRTTFGATPELVAEVRETGIDAWLSRQLQPDSVPESNDVRTAEGVFTTYDRTIKQLRADKERLGDKRPFADQENVRLTIARQIWSRRQLFEVIVDFWNDLFHVANPFDGSELVRASFDTDVIRKHALGTYKDMFLAGNRHPALLRYLNQDQSRKDRVNENLGRENMELYTVGVDGGYTEVDVRQAALLQTGRLIKDDEFFYDPNAHHVGAITVMGFSHPNDDAEGGLEAGDEYLSYLALHPSTAEHIARQLCLHFVSDTPPDSLVARLKKSYLDNRSAIVPVLMTLFSSSEFWGSVGAKVRRPMEYVVATHRALGVRPGDDLRDGLASVHNRMRELGQYPMGQPSPNGYPRVFSAWASAGTMIEEWNEARALVAGGRKGFTFVKPAELLDDAPATAGEFVDALSVRLVGQKLPAKDRAAVLSIGGADGDVPVIELARAILASPYHSFK